MTERTDRTEGGMANGRYPRSEATRGQSARLDRLPPHSTEAEQGVLGCILLAPDSAADCLKQCEERFCGDLQVFYDLRHQRLYQAFLDMRRLGMAIDAITVQAHLGRGPELEKVGGLAYVSGLPDAVPTAGHLPHYLAIVWEKYLARRKVQQATGLVRWIMDEAGLSEPMIEADGREHAEFLKLLSRGDITPKYLQEPSHFGEEFLEQFFGGHLTEAPGRDLPIAFPLKLRRREMTLVSGDNGSGKSTFLNYVALHLAEQPGEKILIASLEMPPAVILWILASQLMGTKRLPDSQAARKRAIAALSWLNERILFYDFTGIADWRDLLDTFAYAAKARGMTCAILDSVMRVGIPDDDYAQQGLAAARFAQAAKDGNYHLLLVVHENKGDAKGKARIRGSKQWSDNADNILVVERNEEKGEKVDKLNWEISREKIQDKPDAAVIAAKEKQMHELTRLWDTRIILRKQRWPGTRQNGAKMIWFDSHCFQFRDRIEETAVDWLERWRKSTTYEHG